MATMAAVELQLHGFTHVSLSVSDLDRSLAFYRDVLQMPVLRDPYDGAQFDGREAMVGIGLVALCLQEHASNLGLQFDPTRAGLDHLAFSVDSHADLERWAARLTEAGVAHSGVKPMPGYGELIELHDPDGILLELHCIRDVMKGIPYPR